VGEKIVDFLEKHSGKVVAGLEIKWVIKKLKKSNSKGGKKGVE
jgi:hypothetical protein